MSTVIWTTLRMPNGQLVSATPHTGRTVAERHADSLNFFVAPWQRAQVEDDLTP